MSIQLKFSLLSILTESRGYKSIYLYNNFFKKYMHTLKILILNYVDSHFTLLILST